MARIAEWRPLPVDVRRRLPMIWQRVTRLPRGFVISAIAILLVVVILFLLRTLSVALLIYPLLMITAAFYTQFRRYTPPELLPRQDEPPPADQCAVRVHLLQGGAVYGSDIGIASVFDGWFHFEGLQTDFALNAEVIVRTRSRGQNSAYGFEKMVLYIASGEHRIEMLVNPFGIERGEPSARKLLQSLRELADHLEPAVGEPTLPPVAVQPERHRFAVRTFTFWSTMSAGAVAVWFIESASSTKWSLLGQSLAVALLVTWFLPCGLLALRQLLALVAMQEGKAFRPIRWRADAPAKEVFGLGPKVDPYSLPPNKAER